MQFSAILSSEDAWLTGDHDVFLDERDVLEPGEPPPEITVPELEASGATHAAALDALEGTTVRARMHIAELYAGIAAVLTDAAACPDPWGGAAPTAHPAWIDPRGLPGAAGRARGRRRLSRHSVAGRAAGAYPYRP